MELCDTTICFRPATVERERTAVFSMTSTSSESKRTVKLCAECAEQEERMKNLNRPETSSVI